MANEPDMKPMERHGLLMEIYRLNRMQTNLWESRRWQAAVAAMQGILADPNTHPGFENNESNTYWPADIDEFRHTVANSAIRNADALIAEFRKQETTNAW